jgi:hypothetical protein
MDGSIAADDRTAMVGTSLRFVPVFFAGLADGVNPCAFATMLFLVSLLALLGKDRRELVTVGLLYAFTIFLTYFAIGLGLLTLVRETMNTSVLRLVLRVGVSASALVLGLLSIRDAVSIRNGRSNEATLQLGLRTKRRIHAVMRSGFGRGGLILGTVGAAFLVSLLELACTGQLYFPTIAYLVQTGSTRAREIGALAAYNLAFVFPLLLLFCAVFFGLESEAANRLFRQNAFLAKGLGAVTLFAIGAAVWLV